MQKSNKINLLVYLALWRRPEITELCFMGLDRLKRHDSFNISVFAVISEKEMIPLCDKYGVKWIMHDNQPLGKKKNYGLRQLKNIDFDYMMEIGSDDLITNELLDQYLDYFGKYECFGISDAAYINSETLECRRLTSQKTNYGAGRCISKKVLEECNWVLWNDGLGRGLDNNSILKIETLGYKYQKVEPKDVPGVIDIKSNENLWKFNYFLGEEYDVNLVLQKLSENEISKLNSLVNVSA